MSVIMAESTTKDNERN